MPPTPDRKAILASVYRFMEAMEDGCTVTIALNHGGGAQFTVPPAPVSARAESGNCKTDILDTLRSCGHRLTTTQLLESLERGQRLWGESTVKAKLAEMVRGGELTSDSKATPSGYGLPEWSSD